MERSVACGRVYGSEDEAEDVKYIPYVTRLKKKLFSHREVGTQDMNAGPL